MELKINKNEVVEKLSKKRNRTNEDVEQISNPTSTPKTTQHGPQQWSQQELVPGASFFIIIVWRHYEKET